MNHFRLALLLGLAMNVCATTHAAADANTDLLNAAIKGDVAAAKTAISQGADVNAQVGDQGRLPLVEAARGGFTELVTLLADSHAGVNAQDKNHDSATVIAASRGHLEVVRILADHDADLNAINYHDAFGGLIGASTCAMLEAIFGGYFDIVKFLISRGVSPKDRVGSASPLAGAVTAANLEMVRYFLQLGADAKETESVLFFKINLLHRVASNESSKPAVDLAISALLIEHGADINFCAGSNPCSSPILSAVKSKKYELFEFLLSKGAKVKGVGDLYGKSITMIAYELGDKAIVLKLIDQGAEIQSFKQGADGDLFWMAASKDDWEFVKAMALRKIDWGIELHMLIRHYHSSYGLKDPMKWLRWILDQGANVNTPDPYYSGSRTALDLAIGENLPLEAIQVLIERGGDANAMDQMGSPVLNTALISCAYGDGSTPCHARYLIDVVGVELHPAKANREFTPFITASEYPNLMEYFDLMVDRGVFKQLSEEEKAIVINRAAQSQYDQSAIIRKLVSLGIEIEVTDPTKGNWWPLYSSNSGHFANTRALLELGANPFEKLNYASPIFFSPVANLEVERTQAYLDHGVSPNEREFCGQTLLIYLCSYARDEDTYWPRPERAIDLAKVLIAAGADVNATTQIPPTHGCNNRNGDTALGLVRRRLKDNPYSKALKKMEEYLLEVGAH